MILWWKRFFDVKQIMKIMFRDIRGILVAIVQLVNTNIDGLKIKSLVLSLKTQFFTIDNESYKQVHGVVMGSPSGPALANIFMSNFENKWVRYCRNGFKPVFY